MSDIINLESVDSTNRYALENYNDLNDRTFVTTKIQTKGKGRKGRSWISQGSNLYASFLIKNPDFEPYKASWLGGLAVLNTIKENTNLKRLWLKWPNDIYIDKKKLCGVLCESKFINNSPIVVIGIGLNVNMTKDELKKIDKPATSLLVETGQNYDIPKIATQLNKKLNNLYDKLLGNGIQEIFKNWKQENAIIGKKVEIESDKGSTFRAKVLDISQKGELIVVDKEGNIEYLFSGEVSIKNF